ncbi:hypothetical protein BCON_0019g00530 [Botryotinia convoluta]|uniref:Uncharacterized protein n=1 Tax=Botryotinia convoluta TaxID=54673 RepID=A0A4Z1J0U4_9HELO|nr:hypothetical protein BCON_0019g00530 [Botryotinia convoluta]
MVIPNLQMPFPVFVLSEDTKLKLTSSNPQSARWQEGRQLLQVFNDIWQTLDLVRTGLEAAKPDLIEVEDCASSYIHEVKCIGLENVRSNTRTERIETMWPSGN